MASIQLFLALEWSVDDKNNDAFLDCVVIRGQKWSVVWFDELNSLCRCE